MKTKMEFCKTETEMEFFFMEAEMETEQRFLAEQLQK
jgi:hypothetical protein